VAPDLMFRRFERWIRGKLSVGHARCHLARDRRSRLTQEI